MGLGSCPLLAAKRGPDVGTRATPTSGTVWCRVPQVIVTLGLLFCLPENFFFHLMGKQMVRLVGKRNLVSKQIFRSGFALCYANATRTTCFHSMCPSTPCAPLSCQWFEFVPTANCKLLKKNKLASNRFEELFFWTLTFEDLILQQVDAFLYHLTR